MREESSHESCIVIFMSRDSPVLLQLSLLNSPSQQLMYNFLQIWIYFQGNSRMLSYIGCSDPRCVAGFFIRKHFLFLRSLVEQPSGWKSFVPFGKAKETSYSWIFIWGYYHPPCFT